MEKSLVVQRVVGGIYVVAGAMKFVPGVEDVPKVLADCRDANVGTLVEGASTWFAANPIFVQVLVAVAMLTSGGAQLLDRWLVRAASVGQILMLCCFMAIIHRFAPPVIVVDLAFVAAAIYIIVHKGRRLSR